MTALIDRLERAVAGALDWTSVSLPRQVALVAVIALVAILPGLASLPVTDRDEARFAQASKQMIETGDLIDIRFQDQPRWKKPVGIYWLQAAAVTATGQGAAAGIWAYRLPSALGAFLAALLTLWAAHPLVGPRGAVLAGAMAATTLLLAVEAHIAKTDAALAATAVAALGALAHLFFGSGGRGTALVFWLAIAVSILLKGPVVPVIAAITVAALWWHRETRPRLGALRAAWGLPLVAALVAPWLVAIGVISDGAFFSESLGRDMAGKLVAGQERHWGPPGLYLALVWATLWPWAALIPAAAGWLWATRRTGRVLFLAAWVIPFWLILEAVPTKLPHYVLPLYPALAIALAAWAEADRPVPRWARRTGAVLLALPAILLSAGAVLLPVLLGAAGGRLAGDVDPASILPATASWPAVLLGGVAILAALVGVRAALAGRLRAQIGASVVAGLALYPAVLGFALPAAGTVFPSPHLAAAIAKWRPCASGPAYSVGYHEPSLVFLTETSIRMADPEGAVAALATDPGALVLLEDRWAAILGSSVPPSVARATMGYFNYNRGKMATATLLTPADPRWEVCAR